MPQTDRSRRTGGRRRALVALTALTLTAGALWRSAPAGARTGQAPNAATGAAPTAEAAGTSGAAAEGRGTGFSPDTQLASWQLYQDLYLTDRDDTLPVATNAANCSAPATTLEFRTGVLRRINYFRAMAGVPDDITLNADFNARAQRVSLMIAANRSISHDPPPSWRCWTSAGAAAANKSNLWISRYGADAVTGWIEDPGAGNTAAGHRRWVLHPPTRQMGIGSVRGPANDPFRTGSALYVMDGRIFDPVPRPRDGFVAWPPPGFVPDDLVFDRFSFGIDGADFTGANVAVSRNGQNVTVSRHAPANGYGINTLVWEVPAADHRPADYHVTVRGVRVNGQSRVFEYDIHAFDATVPPEPVTLTTPKNEAEYARGRTVLADYSCQMTDQVSCVGPVPDGAPIDTSTLGAHSFTVTATDGSGAQESVTHRYSVVDRTKPSVAVTSPIDGASFVQGAPVTADYGCADEAGGSGLASCIGTVADGAPLATSTLGASRPFSVTATDVAGNTRTVERTYAVTQRPDVLIVPTGGSTPAGGGVYSTTATPAQAVAADASRGTLTTFDVTVENDGGATASFLLKGTVAGGAGYRVGYRNGAADITSAVNAGTYSTGPIAPGDSVTITLRVKAKRSAVLGSTVKVDLAARNGAGPFVRDVVRAKVTAT